METFDVRLEYLDGNGTSIGVYSTLINFASGPIGVEIILLPRRHVMSLPPLSNVLRSAKDDSSLRCSLNAALSLLFEPSDVISINLVPQLSELFQSITFTVTTYSAFIDLALTIISSWDTASKAAFIAGHPRIGEVKNLSTLSQKEQAARATSPEILARLEKLNTLYERKYPGLIYITFVNGRSRTEIKDEMQVKLGVNDDDNVDIDSMMSRTAPVQVGSLEWMAELERAIRDVGLIAKNRLTVLDVL